MTAKQVKAILSPRALSTSAWRLWDLPQNRHLPLRLFMWKSDVNMIVLMYFMDRVGVEKR